MWSAREKNIGSTGKIRSAVYKKYIILTARGTLAQCHDTVTHRQFCLHRVSSVYIAQQHGHGRCRTTACSRGSCCRSVRKADHPASRFAVVPSEVQGLERVLTI